MSRDYRKLRVFQKTDELAKEIYKLTKSFPKSEMFGITSQLRRASLSVPTNIVEGSHRDSLGDYIRFLDISLGSLAETGYLLEFSEALGYINSDDSKQLLTVQKDCMGSLKSLIDSFQKLR